MTRTPDPTSLLRDLVAINSVNPVFSGGTTDEREIGAYVRDVLHQAGLEVTVYEAVPNRPSVVARLPGRGTGRSLMLYAHMDTVGVEGMANPFVPDVRGDRLYGRGSYDMKGGLAACIAAAQAIAAGTPLAGDLYVVAVADEEEASRGMEEVLRHVRADGAIVTEPTQLEVCLAHKGFCWIEVVTHGRAAHGSRFDLGVDANLRMGRFLAKLELLERRLRTSAPHPLVGPPSLHAAVLRGGSGASTYAAECRLTIERRTVPGETAETALAEITALAAELAREDATFSADVALALARSPFETLPERAIVRAVAEAARSVRGRPPRYVGETPWMDAALLHDAGVETVVIGPAGAGAHAVEEWVDLASVRQLAQILERAARNYAGAPRATLRPKAGA